VASPSWRFAQRSRQTFFWSSSVSIMGCTSADDAASREQKSFRPCSYTPMSRWLAISISALGRAERVGGGGGGMVLLLTQPTRLRGPKGEM